MSVETIPEQPSKDVMIECENLVKIYKTDEIEVVALQGLDLTVKKGELMAIIGNSGSGKSTLLNMLGGLDKPSAGSLYVDGKNLLKFTTDNLVKYKRDTVGFIWQNNARNLIPYLTAKQNVEIPMLISGRKRSKRAEELLEMVGLQDRMKNKLSQLSGGEQQRVAIAISLANNPQLLLADEPTGSVDTTTSDLILDIFREMNESFGVTIVIVTHDQRISRKVDRVVAIRDGRTSSEFIRKRSYSDELSHLEGLSNGEDGETHEELAVVDKVGRIQIPSEYLKEIGIEGKSNVKIDMEDGKIVLHSPKL